MHVRTSKRGKLLDGERVKAFMKLSPEKRIEMMDAVRREYLGRRRVETICGNLRRKEPVAR